MKASTQSGMNRTGMSISPVLSAELIEAALHTIPSARGDERGVAEVRKEYARDAEPIGTAPPADGDPEQAEGEADDPATARLLDKLGERLAFERTGVRLYQTLISKLESSDPLPGGPSLAELLHIEEEEHAHFELVKNAIESLGGDPTAVTPSADLTAVMSTGFLQVLSDPRTDLRQGLDAILVVELADNDGWSLLIKLCEEVDEPDLASQFSEALASEAEHLENVRRWLEAATIPANGADA
jgi:hypothetical protein